MKNAINYFYNFNVDNMRMVGEDYYFLYKNNKFIFQRVKEVYIDYQAIIELNKILEGYNKPFFRIVTNKNNEIVTNVFDKKYVLMIDNELSDRTFSFFDILETNIVIGNYNKVINRLNRNDWASLWKSKIDYFEIFISHNLNKYLQLNKYANYFIGLGENAVSYFENAIKEEKMEMRDSLVVSHKRINTQSLKQLYNPLYLVIDHRSRDVSEYLKSSFFKDDVRDIDKYIYSINLSNYGARLLMSRMLFPSFFFDFFEELIEERIEEKKILNLIDMMNDYEFFLLRIYNILKSKYNIPEINWIKKVDYSSTLTTPNTSGTSFINIDSMPSLSVTSIMLQ